MAHDNNSEQKLDMNTGLTGSYKGEVTLTLKRKNAIIKTIKGHNAGSALLYKFLVQSLMGLEAAGTARPNQICLIYNTSREASYESGKYSLPTVDVPGNWQARSSFIGTNSLPTPIVGSDTSNNLLFPTNKNSRVTFHFMVPAYKIYAGADTDTSFNQINLYTVNAQDDITQQVLAYYYIPEGTDGWGQIKVTPEDRLYGFTLLVDWTLEFGDQLGK